VTVAAQAMNHWVGALGGMFILVDYFLTAAISCLSGMIYLAVVFPGIGSFTLWITVGVLVLLGLLNWVGISESAKVSLVGAIIAFISDIAILITVFTHISAGEFFSIFEQMFASQSLGFSKLLVGFAGAFLAFSGLESISQLSPVMRTPRKRTAGIALFVVVLTVGLTSPLLTMFSTILLPDAARDPVLQNQLISLLGGHWGGVVLQTEVAISASALLVFASNTAIIGAYHVFMALSRMEFFPGVILKRNKLRNTPHISIALATGIPILILIGVNGRIELLGDMYAFGLLGAFSLTCLGLDIVRWRERQTVRRIARNLAEKAGSNGARTSDAEELSRQLARVSNENIPGASGLEPSTIARLATPIITWRQRVYHIWRSLDFWLGVLTTLLVIVAWCTNLISKPLATAFGGSAALVGMGVALFNYNLTKQQGRLPVVTTTGVEGRLPGSVLAVLTSQNGRNDAIIRTAIAIADDKPVVFLYLGEPQLKRAPRLFEVVDPYLDDPQAKEYFGKAESQAQKARVQRRFIYRIQKPDAVSRVWQIVHPRDIVIAADKASEVEDINPDRVRYEITSSGKVAHLLKTW
ncbi:MAG TPA: APC family permease, partial [Ktedonobacteraceae bacterium]|nr:APC family permease [Ktedonobacteraceae bacterium]